MSDHFGTLCIKGLKANLIQFNISYKIKDTHMNFIFIFPIIYQYINISSKISNHIIYVTYMLYYIWYFDIIDIIDNLYIFDVIHRVWQIIAKVIYTTYNDIILLSNIKKLNKIHVLDNNVTQLIHIPIKHLKLSEQVFSLFQYSEHRFFANILQNRYFQKFCKIHRKAPALQSFSNKVAGLLLQLYQKETPTQLPSCEFWEIFKRTFFTEHLRVTHSEYEYVIRKRGKENIGKMYRLPKSFVFLSCFCRYRTKYLQYDWSRRVQYFLYSTSGVNIVPFD